MTTDRKIFIFTVRRGIIAEKWISGYSEVGIAPGLGAGRSPFRPENTVPAIPWYACDKGTSPASRGGQKIAWPHVWPHLAQNSITKNPGLAQLVARLLWEQDVGSSSLPSRTRINDPTKFKQVDETCEFGRVIFCLESLSMTVFLKISLRNKYTPWLSTLSSLKHR